MRSAYNPSNLMLAVVLVIATSARGTELLPSGAQFFDSSEYMFPCEVRLMKFKEPVKVIIVGESSVAEATVESNGVVVVTARSPGQTSVIVLDRSDQVLFSKQVRVSLYKGASRVTVHRPSKDSPLTSPSSYRCEPGLYCEPPGGARSQGELASLPQGSSVNLPVGNGSGLPGTAQTCPREWWLR